MKYWQNSCVIHLSITSIIVEISYEIEFNKFIIKVHVYVFKINNLTDTMKYVK